VPEDKTCRSCGRRITWRKKWERDWDAVTWCSTACRRRGLTSADLELEERLSRLVRAGSRGLTDVEALAAVQTAGGPAVTPELEDVRRAARRLVAAGDVELLQRGRVVDPSTAAGPVLIRRRAR